MPEYLWWVCGALVVGVLAGYLAGQFRAARAEVEAAGARTRAEEIERRARSVDEERRRLLEQVQQFTGELAAERQKTVGLEDMRASLKAEIENLAAGILEDKSKRFTEQNRTQLEQLLGPLGERLKEFQNQVSQ
jgi:DNA recombination protein RmuC